MPSGTFTAENKTLKSDEKRLAVFAMHCGKIKNIQMSMKHLAIRDYNFLHFFFQQIYYITKETYPQLTTTHFSCFFFPEKKNVCLEIRPSKTYKIIPLFYLILEHIIM